MKQFQHDIYLEYGDQKVAVVATYTRKRYEENSWFLKLNHVYPCDGITKKKLLSMDNLRLVVLRPHGDITYGKCYLQAYCGDDCNDPGFEALWANAYERNEVNVQ